MSGRRLVANLLFEGELERAFPDRAAVPGRRRSTPSRAALETAAAYGTLMRAFAREGDRLWLPAPVDAERMPEVPGLAQPILETGPLADLPPCAEVLAWGESPAVAALRARAAPGAEIRSRDEDQGSGTGPSFRDSEGSSTSPAGSVATEGANSGGLAEALWDLSPAPPAAVARVHHRAFCLEVATSLGCALPGAAMIGSLAELAAHLRSGAAPAGRWVVKAPLSASGRDRYIERGTSGVSALDDPALRHRLERLFAAHGPLLFEPWMERTGDFGACAVLAPEGLRLLGFHRLSVDLRGQFAGIAVDLDAPDAGLAPEEEALFTRTVEGAGAALAGTGYSGPFGVDAWRHRDAQGGLRFHPLGEINARLTFGFVARALAEHLAASGMFGAARRFRLEVSGDSPGALPLLLGPGPGAGARTPLASIAVG